MITKFKTFENNKVSYFIPGVDDDMIEDMEDMEDNIEIPKYIKGDSIETIDGKKGVVLNTNPNTGIIVVKLDESNYVDGSYPGPPIVNNLSKNLAAGGSDGVIGGEFKGSGGPTSSPYPAKYKDKVKNIETKQSPERKKALALLKKLNKQRLKQGKLKKFDDFEKVKENKIILENFGEDYSSWDDEELKQYYRRLEGRIDDYFGGEQKHVGDQGYQELMQDLENVEEVLEERGIYM